MAENMDLNIWRGTMRKLNGNEWLDALNDGYCQFKHFSCLDLAHAITDSGLFGDNPPKALCETYYLAANEADRLNYPYHSSTHVRDAALSTIAIFDRYPVNRELTLDYQIAGLLAVMAHDNHYSGKPKGAETRTLQIAMHYYYASLLPDYQRIIDYAIHVTAPPFFAAPREVKTRMLNDVFGQDSACFVTRPIHRTAQIVGMSDLIKSLSSADNLCLGAIQIASETRNRCLRPAEVWEIGHRFLDMVEASGASRVFHGAGIPIDIPALRRDVTITRIFDMLIQQSGKPFMRPLAYQPA